MPEGLRRAHRALDTAVDRLYVPAGFVSEADRVAHLFKRYEAMVNSLSAAPALNRRTARRTHRTSRAPKEEDANTPRLPSSAHAVD